MDISTRVALSLLGGAFALVAALGFWKGVMRRSLAMRDGRTAVGVEAVVIGLMVLVLCGGAAYALLAAVVTDVLGRP